MTATDHTVHRATPADVSPRRGALRTTRDVVAIIRDVLLIVLMLALFFVGGTLIKAIGDAGSSVDTPEPISTCIGEEVC